MKKMAKIILAASLLISSESYASRSSVFLPPEGCRTDTGQQVRYVPLSTAKILQSGFSIAYTSWNGQNRKPLIYYDNENLRFTPVEFQMFAMYHECGHYALKHIVPNGMSFTGLEEVEADKYAKSILEKRGVDMEPVYATFKNHRLMKLLGMATPFQGSMNKLHSRANLLRRY